MTDLINLIITFLITVALIIITSQFYTWEKGRKEYRNKKEVELERMKIKDL